MTPAILLISPLVPPLSSLARPLDRPWHYLLGASCWVLLTDWSLIDRSRTLFHTHAHWLFQFPSGALFVARSSSVSVFHGKTSRPKCRILGRYSRSWRSLFMSHWCQPTLALMAWAPYRKSNHLFSARP